MISLGHDFSAESKNSGIHVCFMVITGKCFYSHRIKGSDYCFENRLFYNELKLKMRKDS